MDFLAHILWTFIFFWQPDIIYLLLMVLFGVLPDIIPFGLGFRVFKKLDKTPGRIENTPENMAKIPKYFFVTYYLCHSYVIFGVSFFVLYIFLEKIAFILLPWALHITFDLFTHNKSVDIVETKFLYPLSQYSFSGYSWQNRKALIINYILIAVGLILRIFFVDCYINLGV